jgi:hypothetical protein
MLEPIVPKQKWSGRPHGKPRVLHYDSWLTAGGPALVALADEIFSSVSPPAITAGRKHRADAEKRRKACITTLVANLSMAALSPAKFDGIAVSLRNLKQSRYDRAEFNTDVLRGAIQQLQEVGLVTVEDPVFKEKRTLAIPSSRLRGLITERKVGLADVHQVEGRETIELWSGSRRGHDKGIVDYADNERADRLRAEMATVNLGLNAADIRLDGAIAGPIHLVRIFRAEKPNRVITFDSHGRLYGGFWEDLPKGQRYLLTIGGERVADLDFASMFIQLAYCREGIVPPEGDLYAIPGLEAHRKAVKRTMVSLFFREVEAKRLPSGTKEELPEGWSMERFKVAASVFHSAIAHLFDTDVGFELMAMESEILVGILLGLASKGIAALPMHDGIMVGVSNKEIAIETMMTTSKMKLGRELPVVEKPILRLAK